MKLFYSLLSFTVSIVYAMGYTERYMDGTFETEVRPFIYRQLSIQIISLVEWLTHLPYGYAAMLAIGLFGVLFFHSVLYLLRVTHLDLENKEMFSLLALCVFCIIFQHYLKPYDLLIASLFTLAIGFLLRGEIGNYLVVFITACFARETAILLLPIYVVYCMKIYNLDLWQFAFVQVICFFFIQFSIRLYFETAPGSNYWLSFQSNLKNYADNFALLFFFFSVAVIYFVAVSKQWMYKSPILRLAFIVLFPILLFLHILFGQPFEFRTFAEVFPISFILLLPEYYD